MISATLDANTIVSATLVDGGNPWKVLAILAEADDDMT